MELENVALLDQSQDEHITYPYITFKINTTNYCISSQLVSSITMISDISVIPDSPDYIMGLMRHKSDMFPLINLRILLGMPSLNDIYIDFMDKIEKRKNDHINWVNELERCITSNSPFKLATDPHMCAFGKWYYNFKDNENTISSIEMLLNKIEEPHRKLHEASLSYVNNPENQELSIQALDYAKKICHEEILPLLESLKDAFKNQYTSMAIILNQNDKLQAITVDEINSIKYFNTELQAEKINNTANQNYIKAVIKDDDGSLYLEVDSDALLKIIRGVGDAPREKAKEEEPKE